MLSNPPSSSLQARQRQHRRQNSTPTAFDAVKATNNAQQHQQQRRQHITHRRGMSLDTRRSLAGTSVATSSPTNMGFSPAVSSATGANTNNTGLASVPSHPLRGVHQQRASRLRGDSRSHFPSLSTEDTYLVSPHATPHSQRFDQSFMDPMPVPFGMYGQQHMGSMTPTAKDFDIFSPDSSLSTPTFLSFSETSDAMGNPIVMQSWISEPEVTETRRGTRKISNSIMDRVAKFESLDMEGGACNNNASKSSSSRNNSRPSSPPTQPEQSRSSGPEQPLSASVHSTAQCYMPPTPLETSQDCEQPQSLPRDLRSQPNQGHFEQFPNRFSHGRDESMEETIKPNRGRPSQKIQDLFADLQPGPDISQAQFHGPTTTAFDSASISVTNDFQSLGSPTHMIKMEKDTKSLTVSPVLPQQPSPQTPQAVKLPNLGAFENKPELALSRTHPNLMPIVGTPSKSQNPSRRGSPHRRTESLASIASAASIADINIEETRTETGVTMDDIAAYIEGPDPADNKWVCLYESCGKRFGRKENIKSHVQTHLNDRQYQCPTCKKCFVRQHDLKRHAKIHTGIKPYPCECGNSFARHDALTRHRQRGMCIGAFDGIVRKTVKRGRPRKNRPGMDTRLEKSARSRKRNESISSVSSQSGCSDASAPCSPRKLNSLKILEGTPFVTPIGMNTASRQSVSSSSTVSPSVNIGLQFASMASVAVDQGRVASPSAMSQSSFHSVIPEGQTIDPITFPSHPGSPAKSAASHYNTPPGLSASSSPPCATSAQFLDIDANSSVVTTTSTEEGSSLTAPTTNSSLDDHMLLQAWTDGNEGNSLVNLDRDSGILMLSKFDEEYESAVNMFTDGGGDGADVFFGSS